MSKQVKSRRGTTTENSLFTGASGEVIVDTTKNTLVVHDGVTKGGHTIASKQWVYESIGFTKLGNGVWADGQEFNFYNEYMIYNGEAYSPLPATVLPYTVGAVPDLGFVYQIHLNSHPADGTAHNANDIGSTYKVTVAGAVDEFYKQTDYLTYFGIVGDGVTDDTSAFAALESSIQDSVIDLEGKKFLVDSLPNGNDYINGGFKASTTLYPVGNDSGEAYSKAQFNIKRNYSDSRHVGEVITALKGSTVLLGDSISHGAYQGNLYVNGYANILKRMFNAENGSSQQASYGLIPLLSWNTAPLNNTVDIHSIAFIGDTFAINTKDGENLLNSLAFELEGVDAVRSTIPTFQTTCRLWYVQAPDYGSMEVFVNGVSVLVQSTTGTLDIAANVTVPITDNGFGECVIEVKASAGTIAFSGFGYENVGNVFNNFSQSGRKLIDLTEACIKPLCSGSNLILALGHNDVGVVEATPANATKFTENIDLIIKWCLYFNTNVVVPDFCWFTFTEDSHVRRELQRLAKETSGTYIGFPELLTRDRRNQLEFGASFYLVDTLHMWLDASHPNVLGAQWIAETISKAIGLGCTTKAEALSFYDFWMPLQLDPAVLKNTFTTVPNLTSVRKNGNSYQYNIRVSKLVAGGGIAVGSYTLNTTGGLKILTTSNSVSAGIGTIKDADGTEVSRYTIDQQGKIIAHVLQSYLGTLAFSFSTMHI